MISRWIRRFSPIWTSLLVLIVGLAWAKPAAAQLIKPSTVQAPTTPTADEQALANFKSLIDLICSTIATDSWSDWTGPEPIRNAAPAGVGATDQAHDNLGQLISVIGMVPAGEHHQAAPDAARNGRRLRKHDR